MGQSLIPDDARKLITPNKAPRLEPLTESELSRTANRFPKSSENPRPHIAHPGISEKKMVDNYLQRDSTKKLISNSDYKYKELSSNRTIARSTIRTEKNPQEEFNRRLEELAKPPSIHQMASGLYCPPPLFFHKKVKQIEARGEAQKRFEDAVIQQAAVVEYGTEHFEPPRKRSNSRPNTSKTASKNKELEGTHDDRVAPPAQNFIVLNENATRTLLADQAFNLKMDSGTLLDIFLNELARLKTGSTQQKDSNEQFKIVVEHKGLTQAQDPNNSDANGKASTPKGSSVSKGRKSSINFDVSAKDRAYLDSIGTKNGKRDAHLESIQESIKEEIHDESKTGRQEISSFKDSQSFADDFDSMSYNISQTKNSMANKFSTFGDNPNHNRSKHQNPSAMRVEEHYFTDSVSQNMGSGAKPQPSEREFSMGSGVRSSNNSNNLFGSSEKKDGINCYSCGKIIPISKLSEHIRSCMRGSKNQPRITEEEEKSSKENLSRFKSSLSKESYPDDFVQFSGSKTTFNKADNYTFDNKTSRMNTDTFEDEFEDFDDGFDNTDDLNDKSSAF